MKNSLLFILLLFIQSSLFANTGDQWMRSGLKYPVVLAVLFCIFVGIALFLLGVERRLKVLEKN